MRLKGGKQAQKEIRASLAVRSSVLAFKPKRHDRAQATSVETLASSLSVMSQGT
jgi:hypothetical protein